MHHLSLLIGLAVLPSSPVFGYHMPVDTYRACSNNNTCENGLCVIKNGRQECMCTYAWTGERCEEDVNECWNRDKNECDGDSRCVNTEGSYECWCPEGRTGARCNIEIKNCTNDQDCLNGGHCSNNTCVCQSGFEGSLCELEYLDSCYMHNYCGNNGICVSDRSIIDGFTCKCHPGFGGYRCDRQIAETNPVNASRIAVVSSTTPFPLPNADSAHTNSTCTKDQDHHTCLATCAIVVLVVLAIVIGLLGAGAMVCSRRKESRVVIIYPHQAEYKTTSIADSSDSVLSP